MLRIGFIILVQVLIFDEASAFSPLLAKNWLSGVTLPLVESVESGTHSAPTQITDQMKDYIALNDDVGFNNYFANTVGRMVFGGEIPSEPIATFLVDLWEERTDRHPRLNWANATADRFRVLIAVQLFIAERDWGLVYDTAEPHDYARAKATDRDPFVASFALNGIAIKKDPSDAEFLVDVLSSGRQLAAFKSAVRALGWLCTQHAKKALLNLAETENNTDRSSYFLETLDDFYGPGGKCRL